MSALTSSAAFWMFLILLLAVFYLLPTLIALIRGTDNLALIFLINLIGTPALIGWPAAMILAFGPRRLPPQPAWQQLPRAAVPPEPRWPDQRDIRP